MPYCQDTIWPLCQCALLNSNFELIMYCMAHTPASCKSSNSTQVLEMNNECSGSGQGTLSQSLAKVSVIIIIVCTQSGCVLSYSLSQSSEETREFGTDFPRGQDNPNIQYLHACNHSLYFHWWEKTRSRHRNRGECINGCCSDHVAIISGH